MTANILTVEILGRVAKDFYDLTKPQVGQRAAKDFARCMQSLCRTMDDSSAIHLHCAFTTRGDKLTFVTTVDRLDEIAPEYQIKLAVDIFHLLLSAANHVGKLRTNGIEPRIRTVCTDAMRADFLEDEVVLYSRKNLENALRSLIKFLIGMSFHHEGHANILIDGATIKVKVAQTPVSAEAHVRKILPGRIVGTDDPAKACLFLASKALRNQAIWLTRDDVLRDVVARHYVDATDVEIDAEISTMVRKSHQIRGEIVAMRKADVAADDSNHDLPGLFSPPAGTRKIVRTPRGRPRK